MDDLELIKEYEDKLKAYDLALSTIYFDHNTIAPKGGIDYRFECLDIIEKAYYEIKTDEKVYEALKRLDKVELDSVNKRKSHKIFILSIAIYRMKQPLTGKKLKIPITTPSLNHISLKSSK